jgi:hypothetical protein
MWLENIVVVKKPDQAKPTDSKAAQPDSTSTDKQK